MSRTLFRQFGGLHFLRRIPQRVRPGPRLFMRHLPSAEFDRKQAQQHVWGSAIQARVYFGGQWQRISVLLVAWFERVRSALHIHLCRKLRDGRNTKWTQQRQGRSNMAIPLLFCFQLRDRKLHCNRVPQRLGQKLHVQSRQWRVYRGPQLPWQLPWVSQLELDRVLIDAGACNAIKYHAGFAVLYYHKQTLVYGINRIIYTVLLSSIHTYTQGSSLEHHTLQIRRKIKRAPVNFPVDRARYYLSVASKVVRP